MINNFTVTMIIAILLKRRSKHAMLEKKIASNKYIYKNENKLTLLIVWKCCPYLYELAPKNNCCPCW